MMDTTLETVMEALQAYCDDKKAVQCRDDDFQLIRSHLQKLTLVLNTSEQKVRFFANGNYQAIVIHILQVLPDRNVRKQAIRLLTRLIHKSASKKYVTCLVQNGATRAICQTMYLESTEACPSDELLLRIHQLLCRIGSLDKRLGVRARINQCLPITLALLRSQVALLGSHATTSIGVHSVSSNPSGSTGVSNVPSAVYLHSSSVSSSTLSSTTWSSPPGSSNATINGSGMISIPPALYRNLTIILRTLRLYVIKSLGRTNALILGRAGLIPLLIKLLATVSGLPSPRVYPTNLDPTLSSQKSHSGTSGQQNVSQTLGLNGASNTGVTAHGNQQNSLNSWNPSENGLVVGSPIVTAITVMASSAAALQRYRVEKIRKRSAKSSNGSLPNGMNYLAASAFSTLSSMPVLIAVGVRSHSKLLRSILNTLHCLIKYKQNIVRTIDAGGVSLLLDLFLDIHRCDVLGRRLALQRTLLSCLKCLTTLRAARKVLISCGGLHAMFAVCAGYVGPDPLGRKHVSFGASGSGHSVGSSLSRGASRDNSSSVSTGSTHSANSSTSVLPLSSSSSTFDSHLPSLNSSTTKVGEVGIKSSPKDSTTDQTKELLAILNEACMLLRRCCPRSRLPVTTLEGVVRCPLPQDPCGDTSEYTSKPDRKSAVESERPAQADLGETQSESASISLSLYKGASTVKDKSDKHTQPNRNASSHISTDNTARVYPRDKSFIQIQAEVLRPKRRRFTGKRLVTTANRRGCPKPGQRLRRSQSNKTNNGSEPDGAVAVVKPSVRQTSTEKHSKQEHPNLTRKPLNAESFPNSAPFSMHKQPSPSNLASNNAYENFVTPVSSGVSRFPAPESLALLDDGADDVEDSNSSENEEAAATGVVYESVVSEVPQSVLDPQVVLANLLRTHGQFFPEWIDQPELSPPSVDRSLLDAITPVHWPYCSSTSVTTYGTQALDSPYYSRYLKQTEHTGTLLPPQTIAYPDLIGAMGAPYLESLYDPHALMSHSVLPSSNQGSTDSAESNTPEAVCFSSNTRNHTDVTISSETTSSKPNLDEAKGSHSPRLPYSLTSLRHAEILNDVRRVIDPDDLINRTVYDLDELILTQVREAQQRATQPHPDPPAPPSTSEVVGGGAQSMLPELTSGIKSIKTTCSLDTGCIPQGDCQLLNEDELRINQLDIDKRYLEFESRFECGNLRKAIQVRLYEYDLILSPDVNTITNLQWFYFRVSNVEANVDYRFNIINCEKPGSQFNSGMQPLLFSLREALNGKAYWRRVGKNISYYRNHFTRSNQKKHSGEENTYFTATFTLQFPYTGDVCYLAYHYPYPYTTLLTDICRWQETAADLPDVYFRVQPLTRSILDNPVPVITITEKSMSNNADCQPEATKDVRPYIFLTGRVHAGESNSSWVVQGLLDRLLNDASVDPVVGKLRKQFIFKIVPMLNPDGVICGNHRCSMSGKDLNRLWLDPSPDHHPTIFHTKSLLQLLHACEQQPYVFIDFHGHSRMKNIFLYGCSPMESWKFPDTHNPTYREESGPSEDESYRHLAELLDVLAPAFSKDSCMYVVNKPKETAARVAVWREFRVMRSYTLEASYCGVQPRSSGDAGHQMSTSHLRQFGAQLLSALHRLPEYDRLHPHIHRLVPQTDDPLNSPRRCSEDDDALNASGASDSSTASSDSKSSTTSFSSSSDSEGQLSDG